MGFSISAVRLSLELRRASLKACFCHPRFEIDHARVGLNAAELTAAQAAQAKLWCTELQQRATDACVQLHGGYGYMTEYPIARAYADARVTRIYGGTSEVMKTIIAKSLGL